MDSIEANTHSFVIKIWQEETLEIDGRSTWRGRITHVQDGEHSYLKYLDDIKAFITPYLGENGLEFERGGEQQER